MLKKKILAFLLTIIFCLTFFYTDSIIELFTNKSDEDSETLDNINKDNTIPPEKTTSSHMIAVGDNLIHGRIYWEAQQDTTDGSYDFSEAYQNIAPYILDADIASINQETVMDNTQEPSHYPMFNSPIELAYELNEIGFDVISVANNHMFDKGTNGLKNSLELLQSYDDFTVVGAYLNEEAYDDIPIIESNDITFSFLAATQLVNGFSIDPNYGVIVKVIDTEENQQALLNQVTTANQISDVVVVNIHWGDEYNTIPNEFQTSYAQALVDAGADIIIGHHPHIIQPIETLTNLEGEEAIVAYSLGNFLSTQDEGNRMLGGLLDIIVEKTGDKIDIVSCKLKPIITHYTQGSFNVTNYMYSDYTPELASTHGVIEYTPTFSMSYIYEMISNVIDEEYLPEDFILADK